MTSTPLYLEGRRLDCRRFFKNSLIFQRCGNFLSRSISLNFRHNGVFLSRKSQLEQCIVYVCSTKIILTPGNFF